MSFWVYLNNPDDSICKVTNHTEGGTYQLGGTDRAELNVTYNYSGQICTAFNYAAHICDYGSDEVRLVSEQGLPYLNGKKAGEVVVLLRTAAAYLGDNPSDDYWKPSAGNAGHALAILAGWATLYPYGEFTVS